MKNEFELFNVYLGTHKRKEDFFTYYLASCLEFVYGNNKDVFKKILTDVLKLNEIENFDVLSWKKSKTYLKEYYQRRRQPIYDDELKMLREFPLLIPNDDIKKYYLDLAFFIRINDQDPIFVGIEGKVFDSSVTRGQLGKYHNAIKFVLEEKSVGIKLYLLNTIRVRKSDASIELERYRKIRQEVKKTQLIVWDDFEKVLTDKISDKYFKFAFKDAFKQLRKNMESDKKEPDNKGKHGLSPLFDHLKDKKFEINFKNLKKKHILEEGKTKDTLVFDIRTKSLEEQDLFIDCIERLFENKKNIKESDKKIECKKNLEEQLFKQCSDDYRNSILNDFNNLKKINIKTSYVKEMIRKAQNEVKDIKNQSIVDVILSEFLKNNNIVYDFYKQKLFKTKFIKSKYFYFSSATKTKRIGNLGIKINLKEKIQNRGGKISLMTLKQNRIEFQFKK